MRLILITLLSTLLFASCKSTKILGDATGVVAAIEKGSCFGKCPVYAMKIDKTGKVMYEGRINTKKLGKYTKQLTKKELTTIVKAFESANFMTLPNEYASDIPDLPSTMLYYSNGSTNKEVVGKTNRPTNVMQLQYMLEKIADSEDWLLLEAAPPQEVVPEERVKEEVIIYNEIIIEPKLGSLSSFLQDWQGQGVSLKDRLTEDGRLWLISLTETDLTPAEVLAKIKSDSRVITAEFNKKLQPR